MPAHRRKPKCDRKPEYYIARLKQQAGAAPCKEKRANVTSNMMEREERDWRRWDLWSCVRKLSSSSWQSIRYCAFISEDPDSFLEACAPQNFKNYLDWKIDTFNIKKLKSVATYWRNLRMVYTDKTGRGLEDSAGREIMNVWCILMSCWKQPSNGEYSIFTAHWKKSITWKIRKHLCRWWASMISSKFSITTGLLMQELSLMSGKGYSCRYSYLWWPIHPLGQAQSSRAVVQREAMRHCVIKILNLGDSSSRWSISW